MIKYCRGDGSPESINILTIDGNNLETMSLECFPDLETLEVFRWVSGDGDIVIVNEELDVEVLCDSYTCSFSIITFLL